VTVSPRSYLSHVEPKPRSDSKSSKGSKGSVERVSRDLPDKAECSVRPEMSNLILTTRVGRKTQHWRLLRHSGNSLSSSPNRRQGRRPSPSRCRRCDSMKRVSHSRPHLPHKDVISSSGKCRSHLGRVSRTQHASVTRWVADERSYPRSQEFERTYRKADNRRPSATYSDDARVTTWFGEAEQRAGHTRDGTDGAEKQRSRQRVLASTHSGTHTARSPCPRQVIRQFVLVQLAKRAGFSTHGSKLDRRRGDIASGGT